MKIKINLQMKNVLVFVLLVFSLNGISGVVRVKGELENSSEVKKIYLYKYVVNYLELSDSAEISKGKFQFKYKDLDLGRYKIGFSQVNSMDIVLGAEKLSVSADAKNFKSTFSIDESVENDQYAKFINLFDAYEEASSEINMRARKISNADPKKNEKIGKLQTELDGHKNAFHKGLEDIANNYPESYAAVNSTFMLDVDKSTKDNFLLFF